MEKKIAGSVKINISDQLAANKLKALEIAPRLVEHTNWGSISFEKDIYEKAEEILKWAYDIPENSGKQQ